MTSKDPASNWEKQGDIILLHSSLNTVGLIIGDAEAVVRALLDNLGETGTPVVPTFTFNNSDPHTWPIAPALGQ